MKRKRKQIVGIAAFLLVTVLMSSIDAEGLDFSAAAFRIRTTEGEGWSLDFVSATDAPFFSLGALTDPSGRPRAIPGGITAVKPDEWTWIYHAAVGKKEEVGSATMRLSERGAEIVYTFRAAPRAPAYWQKITPAPDIVSTFRKIPFRTLYDSSRVIDSGCLLDVRGYAQPLPVRDELLVIRHSPGGGRNVGHELLAPVVGEDGRFTARFTVRVPDYAPGRDEPLRHVHEYSLHLNADLTSDDGLFSVGLLGMDTTFRQQAFLGSNYVPVGFDESTLTPDGRCLCRFPERPLGVLNMGLRPVRTARYDKRSVKSMTAGTLDKPSREFGLCYIDPASRALCLSNAAETVRAITSVVGHEQIVGWGIDNEYVPEFDYSETAARHFTDWLRHAYGGDTNALNMAWHVEFASFAEAAPPRPEDYAKNPAAWLDWTRFQQEEFAAFLGDLYRTIYETDPLHRRVTGKDTQTSLEMQTIARNKVGNHELIGQAIAPYCNGLRGMDHYGHADRHAYEMSYYYHTVRPDGLKPGRNAGMIYGESNNHNGPAWQFDQTFYRMIANGWRGGNFFCDGWFGSRGDWSSFSFINTDGIPRDKLFSVARLYGTIHRSEELFAKSCVPDSLPRRLALLMPQRDVPFGADDPRNPWEFAANSRLAVFEHLRRAGYWVDVITYHHLAPDYLKRFDGLFLVAAEHLTVDDIANIRTYVRDGGILFADTRAGRYDEHHRPHADGGLSDVLGVRFRGEHEKTEVDPGDVWFASPRDGGNTIRADGRINADIVSAELLNRRRALNTSNKAARLTRHRYGKGQAFWVNTQLGTLRAECSLTQLTVTEWFAALLRTAGLAPSYEISDGLRAAMRCEQPIVDGRGNAAVFVSAATEDPMPAAELTVPLPAEARFVRAFASCAESTELAPVAFTRGADGRCTFSLPAYKTALTLLLLGDHEPLLSYRVTQNGTPPPVSEFDPNTPCFKPGDTFEVALTLTNPGGAELESGTLALRVLQDWRVASATVATPRIAPGGTVTRTFQVTVPEVSEMNVPHFLFPLLAQFRRADGTRAAVYHGVVTLDIPFKGQELLLTDNWTSANYPWAEWTGGITDMSSRRMKRHL